jgi:hypothetical protein
LAVVQPAGPAQDRTHPAKAAWTRKDWRWTMVGAVLTR